MQDLESATKLQKNDRARCFALGVEHGEIDLTDIHRTLRRATDDKQTFDEIQNTFIGQKLYDALVEKCHFVDLESVIVWGNQIFAESKSEDRGLKEMFGLEGEVVYTRDGSPELVSQPCSGHFLEPILVSDFFAKFFGPVALARLPIQLLKQAKSILQGVRVYAGGRHEEKRDTPITGIGPIILLKPATLGESYGKATAATMKYPAMPTIIVGSTQTQILLPAEHCQIVGHDRQFHVQLPLALNAEAWKNPPIAKGYP